MLTQDLKPVADTEQATLDWLVDALEHAHARGQTKLVGYLEEVADEVVFDVEMAARQKPNPSPGGGIGLGLD